jgi:hypothetical protein
LVRWAGRRSFACAGRSSIRPWRHCLPHYSTIRSLSTSHSQLAVRTSSVTRYTITGGQNIKCHKVHYHWRSEHQVSQGALSLAVRTSSVTRYTITGGQNIKCHKVHYYWRSEHQVSQGTLSLAVRTSSVTRYTITGGQNIKCHEVLYHWTVRSLSLSRPKLAVKTSSVIRHIFTALAVRTSSVKSYFNIGQSGPCRHQSKLKVKTSSVKRVLYHWTVRSLSMALSPLEVRKSSFIRYIIARRP